MNERPLVKMTIHNSAHIQRTSPGSSSKSMVLRSWTASGGQHSVFRCLFRHSAWKTRSTQHQHAIAWHATDNSTTPTRHSRRTNNSQNQQVHGALSLHVGDLLKIGRNAPAKEIMGRLQINFVRILRTFPRIRTVAVLPQGEIQSIPAPAPGIKATCNPHHPT